MAGVEQRDALRLRIRELLLEVDGLMAELQRDGHTMQPDRASVPTHAKRPRLRLIKGVGAVVAVPLLWARDHTAQAAVAVLIGAVSGGSGLVAGSVMAPAPADAEAHPQPYQGQPYEGTEVFDAPRHVPSSSGHTPGAVSPSASPPTPTGAPGPAPAQHDATPNPTLLPPLQGTVSLEPEPGLAPPTSTPTSTMTPMPTPTPNPGLARKAAVLECVGEPGGEPPEDLVACVDSLLGGDS